MARTTLPGDERQEEKLNPGQQHADRTFDDIARREEKGTFDDIVDNNYSKGEKDELGKIKEKESEGSWANNISSGDSTRKTPFTAKAKTFFKKRGGILGLIIALAIGGGAVGTFFGPASMLINLAENVTLKNDTSSTSLQHRFLRVFGFTIAAADPICANSSKSIKCKMGQISNKALDKLEKKGITPVFDNDTDTNSRKKTGYPTKNPTAYRVDLGNGNFSDPIDSNNLLKYLADNPKAAAKVLGRAGAFNVRINAWSGKHITQKLFKKFGLNRNGGLADGSTKRLTPVERLAEASKKLQEKMPGAEKMDTVPDGVEEKIRGHLGKAAKAGVVYAAAVGSCIAVKAPGYVAAGVAAIQLAQVMPVGMDVILSPGSKAKASGVDTANSVTSEDMDSIGTLLTNKTPRESDGKMTSALDSEILLAAANVNTAKPAVSKDYTPGYSMLTNPIVTGAQQADKTLAPACNVIMSPAAMYTAMTVSTAATVLLAPTIVGGIIKVFADVLGSAAITQIAVAVAGDAARTAVTELASNDKIASASGEALGDVAGISMMAMFSAGGMARNLPVLKNSQVADFNVASAENEAFNRDMDIATLSPFDTSSKYTFLGSIVNNAQLAVLQSGAYNGNALSSLPGLMNFSKASLSTNTKAADDTAANYCGYAEQFGLTAPEAADTPAINAAGLPCTGLTNGQIGMSTGDAISLMINEGWLDEEAVANGTIVLSDDDSITKLMTKKYIKPESPLADYINSCSNAQTGDYIFNAAGCTVNSTNGGSVKGADPDSELPDLKDPRSLEAMAVFLLDYQQIQAINGNDEDDGSTGEEGAEAAAPTTPTTGGDITDKKALAQKIIAKNKITYLGNVRPILDGIADGSVDANAEPCGININILRMIDMITDKHSIKISDINRHCTGSLASSKGSRHYAGNGSAIDIAVIDGVSTNGRDANAMSIIAMVMPILSESAVSTGSFSQLGQGNCGPSPGLGASVRTIVDSCNHLHMDVPAKSDPALKYDPSGW